MYFPLDDIRHHPDWLRIVTAKKYRRACSRILLVLLIIFLISLLTGLTIFDHQHNNIILEYVTRHDDIAVLSATFYKHSRSYPNNTVVVLFNAHQVFHLKHSELQIVSSNDSYMETTSLRIHQVVGMVPFYCKWVPFVAIGQVVNNMNWLEISSSGNAGAMVEIHRPYQEKHDVVSCFSPMFLNERWELLILTAEVYSHYGAFMHFYVRSMISSLFRLLKKYPNSRVTPWPSVKLGIDRANSFSFDPNLELEFRNQASAMTDCLLLYKESAEFIMFPDPDDVIIPRMADSYFGEFLKVFEMYPNAATVAYNMTQTTLSSSTSTSLYSPVDVLQSIRFMGEARWGKLVVKPYLVDSVWIHQSYGIRKGYDEVALPIANNSALHLRFWKMFEDKVETGRRAEYNPFALKNTTAPDLIPQKDLEQIQISFLERIKENNVTYNSLPEFSLYYPLIEKCYNRIFYNGESHAKCKGPELCDLSEFPGIHCVNTEAEYETFTEYDSVYVHILRDFKFKESHNGCKL